MRFSFEYLVKYYNIFDDIEKWSVVTYPQIKANMYEISSKGHIRRISSKNELSYRIHRGYITCQLMTNSGRSKEFRIHRLVAFAFVNGFKPDLVVNHKDGNKQNNDYKNLEWVSQYDNIEHANRMGLINHPYGEKINTTNLSNDEVAKICKCLVSNNGNVQDTHNEFPNVNESIIRNIRNKSAWRSISDSYFTNNTFDVYHLLTEPEVIKICIALIKENGNVDEVIEKLKNEMPNINKRIIDSIKNKNTYVNISDRYFNKTKFRNRLLPDDAEQISRYLKKFNGDIQKVYEIMSDNPRITMSRIKHVLDKESHVSISDKYFSKKEFSKS